MDKVDFIEKAPQYYALAIAIGLQISLDEPKTISEIVALFDRRFSYNRNITRLSRSILAEKALQILQDQGCVDIITDDFGPALYIGKHTLNEWITVEAKLQFPIFDKYFKIENLTWLEQAIAKINSLYDEFNINVKDFSVDAGSEQWEPIPLDRTNEKLISATKALDAAIEIIEQDNGYAITASRERDFVITNLRSAIEIINNRSSIYYSNLKTLAIDPLTQVIKRFGTSAVGTAASAAKAAIAEWLKNLVESGLTHISHLFFN